MFKSNGMDSDWCWSNYLNFRALKQADSIREQLVRIMGKQQISLYSRPATDSEYYPNIKKAILSGFFMQVALKQRAGHYQTLKDD